MAGLRVDLIVKPNAVSWRMWSGSRIIGGSTEAYRQRARAITNLEAVTGGTFEQISTPDTPTPYGRLHFAAYVTDPDLVGARVLVEQTVPVRLLVEP